MSRGDSNNNNTSFGVRGFILAGNKHRNLMDQQLVFGIRTKGPRLSFIATHLNAGKRIDFEKAVQMHPFGWSEYGLDMHEHYFNYMKEFRYQAWKNPIIFHKIFGVKVPDYAKFEHTGAVRLLPSEYDGPVEEEFQVDAPSDDGNDSTNSKSSWASNLSFIPSPLSDVETQDGEKKKIEKITWVDWSLMYLASFETMVIRLGAVGAVYFWWSMSLSWNIVSTTVVAKSVQIQAAFWAFVVNFPTAVALIPAWQIVLLSSSGAIAFWFVVWKSKEYYYSAKAWALNYAALYYIYRQEGLRPAAKSFGTLVKLHIISILKSISLSDVIYGMGVFCAAYYGKKWYEMKKNQERLEDTSECIHLIQEVAKEPFEQHKASDLESVHNPLRTAFTASLAVCRLTGKFKNSEINKSKVIFEPILELVDTILELLYAGKGFTRRGGDANDDDDADLESVQSFMSASIWDWVVACLTSFASVFPGLTSRMKRYFSYLVIEVDRVKNYCTKNFGRRSFSILIGIILAPIAIFFLRYWFGWGKPKVSVDSTGEDDQKESVQKTPVIEGEESVQEESDHFEQWWEELMDIDLTDTSDEQLERFYQLEIQANAAYERLSAEYDHLLDAITYQNLSEEDYEQLQHQLDVVNSQINVIEDKTMQNIRRVVRSEQRRRKSGTRTRSSKAPLRNKDRSHWKSAESRGVRTSVDILSKLEGELKRRIDAATEIIRNSQSMVSKAKAKSMKNAPESNRLVAKVPITSKANEDPKTMLEEIRKIRSALKEKGFDPKVKIQIASKLNAIDRRRRILQELRRIQASVNDGGYQESVEVLIIDFEGLNSAQLDAMNTEMEEEWSDNYYAIQDEQLRAKCIEDAELARKYREMETKTSPVDKPKTQPNPPKQKQKQTNSVVEKGKKQVTFEGETSDPQESVLPVSPVISRHDLNHALLIRGKDGSIVGTANQIQNNCILTVQHNMKNGNYQVGDNVKVVFDGYEMIAKYVKHIKVDGNEKDIALLVFDNSSKNKYHSYCQKNGRPILQIPKYKPTILTREDVGQVAKVIGYHGDTQNDVCGATGKLVYDDGIWKHMISTEHGCSGAGVTRNDKMYGVHTKGKDAEDRNGFEAFTKEILLEIEQGMRDLNC